jgi:hypothetical protein
MKALAQSLLNDLAPIEAAFDEGLALQAKGFDTSAGLALCTAGALVLMADGVQRMALMVSSHG